MPCVNISLTCVNAYIIFRKSKKNTIDYTKQWQHISIPYDYDRLNLLAHAYHGLIFYHGQVYTLQDFIMNAFVNISLTCVSTYIIFRRSKEKH